MTTSHVDHRLESADAASFSLVPGGLLHRMGVRVGIPDDLRGTVVLGAILALVTWRPLLILSAVDGTLMGGRMVPFLPSVGTHMRFLVAIPLFFIAEAAFDLRTGQVVGSSCTGRSSLHVSSRSRAFDEKWLRQRRSAAGNSFDVIRQMRLVPIETAQIVRLAIAAAAPALPLVLFVIPSKSW